MNHAKLFLTSLAIAAAMTAGVAQAAVETKAKAVYYGNINADSTINGSAGITGVAHPAMGEYLINFTAAVNHCAATVSFQNGFGFETVRPLSTNQLQVYLYTSDGSSTVDEPFNIVVAC
jgi:hypothetical protein